MAGESQCVPCGSFYHCLYHHGTPGCREAREASEGQALAHGIVQEYETIPTKRSAIRWTGNNLALVQNFVGFDTDLRGLRTEKFQHPVPDWFERVKDRYPDWPAITSAMLYEALNASWKPVRLGDWIVKYDHGFRVYEDDYFTKSFRSAR